MSNSSIKPVQNYAGLFDSKTSPYNETLSQLAVGCIQPERLFAIRYQVLPCSLISNQTAVFAFSHVNKAMKYLHATSIIQFLINEYKVDPNAFISRMGFDIDAKLKFYTDVYIDLGDYLGIYLSGGALLTNEVENPLNLRPDIEDKKFFSFNSFIIYLIPPALERAQKLITQLSAFSLYMSTETCLLMVCFSPQSGFYTSNITIKQPIIKNLGLNYGDAFPAIHEKLIEQLRKPNSSGITFLHGPPGTGKTYYIRFLINEIQEKNLIYVPPDLVNEITKPGFLPFLMQHPDSILIIEDAENIILDRKETVNPNQAVSNLLNLSDGLLGDAMRLQIITTFNCEMKAIDAALLREGRLVVEHKFEKLSVDNARRLFEELNIEGADQITQPMSLAEVYAKRNVSQ